ncbi:MAG: ShlB/FhaC/HecB family hemolysin secretion/activation protein [Brevundimonas sp.]|nr:MAG: ShlB/FhaC/HecB family hemolysin secretion/activation protein [Brevundimonas sp.]
MNADLLRPTARCLVLLSAAAMAPVVPAPARAQTAEAPCPDTCYVLTAMTIQGVTVYPLAELTATYDHLLARRISVGDLVQVAAAITDKYRADGYFLTRAVVAPTDVTDGSATIVVYEGYVGDLEIIGPGAAAVRPLLASLTAARPLSIADLDHRLSLASDVPGVELTSSIEPVLGDPARHRLAVNASRRAYTARAYLENRGSPSQGPWQAYLTTSGNSLLAAGDQLTLSMLTTPERVDELTFAELAYSTSLGQGRRFRFALSGYTTDAPPSTTNNWLSGRSKAVSINLSQPLLRSRQKSLWLNAALDRRRVEQIYSAIGLADEDLSVARLSLSGQQRIAGASLTGFAQVSQGLEALGSTTQNAPNLTRSDADGVFTKFNLGFTAYRDIGRYAGIYGQVAAQWSGDPLLNSEEFAVGGSPFGRGYNYGELSGDSGVAGLVELRLGWDPAGDTLSFVQFYSFLDAASVSNHGTGGDRTDELSAAGGGLRLTFREKTTLELELAKPMSRAPYSEPDNDWRGFVSLNHRF